MKIYIVSVVAFETLDDKDDGIKRTLTSCLISLLLLVVK
jgi:hypothetical protein